MVNRRNLLKLSALGTASFAAPLAYSASKITMAYNTGNPPGSSSPKDLIDDAEDFDYLLTGEGVSHPNRLGVSLKSWKGMEGEHNAAQVRRESEFDADQAERVIEFGADQENREFQFNAFMSAGGLEPPLPYTGGMVLTRTTQTVTYLGNEYRAKSAFLPLTTTNWAADEDKMLLVGDDSLRQQLADPVDPEKGAGMVAWKPHPLTEAMRTVGHQLSSGMPNIWAYEEYVVDRQTGDPDTWDWTPAFHAVQVLFKAVYVPRGNYRIAGIRQKVDYFRIIGESQSATTLYVSAGVGIYDYEGPNNERGIGMYGLEISNLTIAGPYVNPDTFSAPTNSWALASGLSKDLSDTSLVGIRLRRSARTIFSRVKFTGLHVGIDQYGGIAGLVDLCLFDNLKIGYRCQNGAVWGDPSYKTTTMTFRKNNFSNLWIGQYLNEWVDGCRSSENIFEPVNTATYVLNGGSARGICLLEDYYERCFEGIVFNGGSLSRWTVRDPYFAGTPGFFWGYGKSIEILAGASASFRLHLEGGAMGGGGLLNSSNGRVIADNLAVAGGVEFNTLYLKDRKNTPVAYDPMLTRGARMWDFTTGIGTPVEESENGVRVVAFPGSGTGLAFNGLRFRKVGPRFEPTRIRFQYKYDGTNTGFQPIGVRIGSSLFGPVVVPSATWLTYDVTIPANSGDFTLANFQGGFDGTLRIKGFPVSDGYGFADSYEADPRVFFDVLRPSRGTSDVGDRWRPSTPVVGQPKEEVCTVQGSPGTWVSTGNL